MQNTKMFELADKLKEKRDEKGELDFKVKEINAEIEELETALIDEMTSEEISNFKRNGTNYVVVTKEYPSPILERKAELYNVMKEQGYEYLFTINSQTLSATIKELKANNDNFLPDWLDGLVKVCEKQNIQLRKG